MLQIAQTKWNRYYDLSKVEKDINPDLTIYEILKQSADRYADRIALEYGYTRITFRALLEMVDKVASAMWHIGIRKGDVVTLSHNGMPSSVAVIYAASKIGASVSLVNNALTGKRLDDIVKMTRSRYFFVSNWKTSEFRNFFESVQEKVVLVVSKTKDYTTMSYRSRLMYGKYRVRDANRDYLKLNSDNVNVLRWPAFLEQGEDEPEVCSDPLNTAAIFHSGSATGAPIPVEASSTSLNYKVISNSYLMNKNREDSKPIRVMSCVKHTFSFGLSLALHTAITLGDTLVLYPDAGRSFPEKEILHFKPEAIIGYPAICSRILESGSFSRADLSFLKLFISAGESMPGMLCDQFRQFLVNHNSGAPVYRLYGLTESLSAVCYNPPEFDNDRIIGIPLPGVNMKILDRDTGMEMPYGTRGEICISYSGNMKGYLNNPEITSEIIRKLKDGKQWLFTGDFGREDENGIFTFDGHTKRVVDMGGVHVYPEVVENEIKSISGVDTCCVVPVGDSGKFILALLVVPEEEYITDNDKLEELKQRIVLYSENSFFPEMRPGRIEFRVYLPEKAPGTPDYEAITAQLNTVGEGDDAF